MKALLFRESDFSGSLYRHHWATHEKFFFYKKTIFREYCFCHNCNMSLTCTNDHLFIVPSKGSTNTCQIIVLLPICYQLWHGINHRFYESFSILIFKKYEMSISRGKYIVLGEANIVCTALRRDLQKVSYYLRVFDIYSSAGGILSVTISRWFPWFELWFHSCDFWVNFEQNWR